MSGPPNPCGILEDKLLYGRLDVRLRIVVIVRGAGFLAPAPQFAQAVTQDGFSFRGFGGPPNVESGNALLSDDERQWVIRFYVTAAVQIRLIAIYKKGIKDDLNAAEKKILKKLNENW